MENEYKIYTENLNSSLVFYRSLFDKMPEDITAFSLEFKLDDLKVRITEDVSSKPEESAPFHLAMDKTKMKKVLNRMKRFTRLNQIKEDCEEPEESIGLTDPDGNQWIIGAFNEELSFEKCYINF